MNRRRSIFAIIVMGLVLSFCFQVWAKHDEGHYGRKTVRPSLTQMTRFSLGDSEFVIPASATDREISVEMVEPDLEGIRKPFGFRAVSKVYRFGPHGLKFSRGREIEFNIKLSEENQKAKLYYINRETQCLERVDAQNIDQKNRVLKGKLKHFSEYVLGITPGWDGNGIIPFFDITHGDETVQILTLNLIVRKNIISLPGRGLNFTLARVYSARPVSVLKVDENWYWDLPYTDGTMINIPGEGSFDFTELDIVAGYSGGDAIYRANGRYFSINSSDEDSIIVYLDDGTRIENYQRHITVSDPNGNYYQYYINPGASSDDPPYLEWLRDSMGRMFYFDGGTVTQLLKNGKKKVIASGGTMSFTDALGRTTTFSYKGSRITKITYYNGARSEYSYNGGVISQQRFYKPNETLPFRVVNYSRSNALTTVFDDGNKVKKYVEDSRYNSISHEYTYTLSNQLVEQKEYTYYYDNVFKSITTTRFTADGNAIKSTFQYEYDDWGNITRIVDPYGNETLATYANTSSSKVDLSKINSKYQKSLYASKFSYCWNKPITKATLIKNPLDPNNPQLKQTHYQYDSKGNLIKESEAYGNSYLHTTYTYDKYGNVLTKTDANGKTFAFEYSTTYNYAYLTRVYKPDTNETIATYEYDFDTGNKIKATDPKGNVFRYEYDALNRLTKEWQESTDPKIAIYRIIQYDDLNNVVVLKYGNDTVGYQAGRIEYDPLFGKPIKLQRYKSLVSGNAVLSAADTNWITQKVIEYGTNGLVAVEKTWEREDLPPHVTSYQYDEFDRKTVVIQPDGSRTRYEYDGKNVTITDAKDNKKVEYYDLLDRLIQVDEYPGPNEKPYTTQYIYDSYYDSEKEPAYRLVKVINPKKAETIYTYDNLGRLIRTDYPQNLIAAEHYTYDNVGNLKTKTNGKGIKTIEYEFFAGYRPVKIVEPDGREEVYL